MNFLNIKYFIAIAEEKNISAAARKLFVSQQSLSEHLKKLEAEVGAPLFKRDDNMNLTVAGECFYESAKELQAAYDRMLANINDATTNRRSKISIGIATYDTPPFLADLLVRFRTQYPQYEIRVIKRQHSDILHNMNGVDLYFSYLPLEDGLEHVMLLPEDPYCVLLHTGLATQIYGENWKKTASLLTQTRDLSLLKQCPFVILTDRQNQIARDLTRIFEEYHFSPVVGFSSENGELNAEMCRRGCGALLAPGDFIRRRFFSSSSHSTDNNCPPNAGIAAFSDVASISNDLCLFPIRVTCFHSGLAICYQHGKHLHSAERRFIEVAQDFFRL